jgi:AraC-like DNA-binding protein
MGVQKKPIAISMALPIATSAVAKGRLPDPRCQENCVESPVPAGAFKIFRPPSLAGIADAIWDLDIPDARSAGALTIKYAPGTSFLLVAQYRAQWRSDRQFGSIGGSHGKHQFCAVQLQTGVVTARPSGPVGTIVICLKPEAAVRITGEPLQSFADTKIDLHSLFHPAEVSLLGEMLCEAQSSRERVAIAESFLLRLRNKLRPPSLACRAAALLRSNPALPVLQLAAQLDISRRHLSRSFQATFGTSPKQFVRLARIEAALAARQHGQAWVDIAYACGFSDQTHLIRDFKAIIGQPPEDFFRTLNVSAGVRLMQFYRPSARDHELSRRSIFTAI